jgi:hypothetical protein
VSARNNSAFCTVSLNGFSLLLRVCEVPGWILGPETGFANIFRGFPNSFQENRRLSR